jgi:hypothetical protein
MTTEQQTSDKNNQDKVVNSEVGEALDSLYKDSSTYLNNKYNGYRTRDWGSYDEDSTPIDVDPNSAT